MKPPAFEYRDPRSLEEALELLEEYGTDAKVLAGGQSLMPMLNMRLVRPACLVDINRLPGLDYIREENGQIAIGALTRQRTVERDRLVQERCPILAGAVSHIGHMQIRNRGTVGGSLAHADPAAELPAVCAALGATFVISSRSGQRVVPADEYFYGWFSTAVQPGELLTEVRFPVLPPTTGWSFLEIARRSGDFALCAAAAVVDLENGYVRSARLALSGVGPGPVVPQTALQGLVGQRPEEVMLTAAAMAAAEETDPESDVHATAEYRRHLTAVLTCRALTQALERARKGGTPV